MLLWSLTRAGVMRPLSDREIESDKFPLAVIRLKIELHDSAKIHLKVPPFIHRKVQYMASEQADQAFVADDDNVLICVGVLFFSMKFAILFRASSPVSPPGKRKSVFRSANPLHTSGNLAWISCQC